LQLTYDIPDRQILHIHGKASDPSDRLILGHGWKRTSSDSLNHDVDMSEADIRVIEGNEIVDGYFSATFKPTAQIIADNQTFFSNLKAIRQIYVMGHSLAEVDAPYFAEIIRNIDSSSVRWMISYHCNPTDAQAEFSKFGIDMSLADFATLDDTHRRPKSSATATTEKARLRLASDVQNSHSDALVRHKNAAKQRWVHRRLGRFSRFLA
jgi:hypothetical protein